MKKHKPLLFASVLSAGLSMAASAAVITVNTANNSDFGVGMTNLWLAIQLANTNGDSANTINFNISGAGPHYIVTPQFSAPGGVPAPGRSQLDEHRACYRQNLRHRGEWLG